MKKVAYSIAALLAAVVAALPQHGTSSIAKPPVDPKSLQETVKLDALMAHAGVFEKLAYATPERNRYAGTKGHNDTLQYIIGHLEALGDHYEIEMQPFVATLEDGGEAELFVDGVPYFALTFRDSPEGTVKGPVAIIGGDGCNSTDYPEAVRGSIALISRGTCTFSDKSALAGKAGAVGAIVYNNEEGDIHNGNLGRQPNHLGFKVLTVGVSQATGQELVSRVQQRAAGEIMAKMSGTVVYHTIYSHNLIATTRDGSPDDIFFLGAHSDSVEAGPGINDNGSGSAALLELAIQLANFTTGSKVRFAWWTAEEEGLLGSNAYVNSTDPAELDRVRLYVNFDMLASPNYKIGVYDGDGSTFGTTGPDGSAQVQKLWHDYFAAEGLNSTASEFDGRSDYRAFLRSGIPCGGLDTGAEKNKSVAQVSMFGGRAGVAYDKNYHGPGDNLANLNKEAFLIMTRAIAHAVGTYGRSFEGFPLRSTTLKNVEPLDRRARR